jgi:hypothetical protein
MLLPGWCPCWCSQPVSRRRRPAPEHPGEGTEQRLLRWLERFCSAVDGGVHHDLDLGGLIEGVGQDISTESRRHGRHACGRGEHVRRGQSESTGSVHVETDRLTLVGDGGRERRHVERACPVHIGRGRGKRCRGTGSWSAPSVPGAAGGGHTHSFSSQRLWSHVLCALLEPASCSRWGPDQARSPEHGDADRRLGVHARPSVSSQPA